VAELTNMKFAIYFRDREYAREAGDPLLCVIDAASKAEAEAIAYRSGIQSFGAGLWAWPLPQQETKNRKNKTHHEETTR
jgi:hypothetical protein